MKAVAQTFYNNPIVFLGSVQGVLTALSAAGVVTGWIPVASLALITPVQRYYVNPRKGRR